MFYIYIINILIYSGIRSVLSGACYSRYRNIKTIQVFESFDSVPVRVFGSGFEYSVPFRFGSLVPVFFAKA